MIQIFESDLNNDGNLVPVVNAREFYEALGMRKDYGNWIRWHLRKFEKNRDFITFIDKSGEHPRHNYFITLDTAKHICRVSQRQEGEQLLQYLIKVEKRYRLVLDPQPQIPVYTQSQIPVYTQSQIPVYTQTEPEPLPGTPEHFARAFTEAYQQIYGATDQQPVIEHNTEPVVPCWGAGSNQSLEVQDVQEVRPPAPVLGYYNPCPDNKINMKGLKEYLSNERLIKYLIKKFNIENEIYDYGYINVKGKAESEIVYDKRKTLAILHAAYALSTRVNATQREFMGIVFTMYRVLRDTHYDKDMYDTAYTLLEEDINKLYKID
ncbi:hypothetical protein PU12_19065 [Escherichia coli]|nr:hypothetical protein PU12_19065 [Escherichia coli]